MPAPGAGTSEPTTNAEDAASQRKARVNEKARASLAALGFKTDTYDEETDGAGQGGAEQIPVDQIYHASEKFSKDVTPLKSNDKSPIIVVQTDKGYQLLDGFGRVSGLRNAGASQAHAIVVSKGDLLFRDRKVGVDDHDWNESMFEEYAPHLEYRTTN